jgi:negative regulator of flagellin synthesis FlgM
MRINPYIQVQQVYNNSKVSKTGKAANVSRTDGLEISSVGKDIQTAKTALAQTPDIREDVVARIKSQVQNGTYDVSPSAFADKLLEAYEGK